MKNLVIHLCSIPLAILTAAGAQTDPPTQDVPPPLLHVEFQGFAALRLDTNAVKFREMAALPESLELLNTVLDKGATAPFRHFKSSLPDKAKDHAALVRPLLENLLQSKFRIQARGSLPNPQWALAVQPHAQSAKLWETNLEKLLSDWTKSKPSKLSTPDFTGWEITTKGGTLFQWQRHKDWIVLSTGPAGVNPAPRLAWIRSLTGSDPGQPGTPWLDMRADTLVIRTLLPFLSPMLPPGSAHYSLTGDGETVRVAGSMQFAKPLDIPFEPWSIPTNLVRNPNNSLVSFTAVRGIRPLLSTLDFLRALKDIPVPNQLTTWGQSQFFGQTLFAIPMDNPAVPATAIILEATDWITKIFGEMTGSIVLMTNRSEGVWRGLPLIVPFLKPDTNQNQSYLLGGLVPILGGTSNSAPEQLFAQFTDKKDLVYYDWEITGPRLIHNRHFFQLGLILSKRQTLHTNSLPYKWIQAANPLLGNTITEITHTAPSKLELTRKSHAGLTAPEIVLLGRWIDSPEFPLAFSMPNPMSLEDLGSKKKPRKPVSP